MAKTLDLTKSVHDLVQEYPEVSQIMFDLGFTDIVKPLALHTAGRVMTIPKGAAVKGIDLQTIVQAFEAQGFEVVGLGQAEASAEQAKEKAEGRTEVATAVTQGTTPSQPVADVVTDATAPAAVQAGAEPVPSAGSEAPSDTPANTNRTRREELLQGYVARLSAGEPLESVRADFVANFQDVDAAEIAHAEQSLIEGGAKVDDVQRLCDVHSALFHGATTTEQAEQRQDKATSAQAAAGANSAASGERAVLDALTQGEPDARFEELAATSGHPVNVFVRENAAIAQQAARARKALGTPGEADELARLARLGTHYAKKGDLLYPILKVNHGFSGPSEVMWGVDDEIRAELRKLLRAQEHDDAWRERARAVIQRAEEMTYKEHNILLPLCVQSFSNEEWLQMYRDMKGYDLCLIEEAGTWEAGERWVAGQAAGAQVLEDGARAAEAGGTSQASTIKLPTGEFTAAQLDALLNTLPLEISFVDDHDINRYWNDDGKPKLFKRPSSALGREVYSCHPPKVEKMVRGIIASFRSGERDSVEVWMSKEGEPVLVRYLAVRDREGNYLGTAEVVQRMGFAEKHFDR